MKFKDRLIIFGFGVILGAILVAVIKSQRGQRERDEIEPATVVEIQRAAAPGIVQAYLERRAPMQSDYISGTKLYPLPEPGRFRRVLILQGIDAEQTVRIEEFIQRRGRDEILEQVRVTSPDRVLIEVNPGYSSAQLADAIRFLGFRVVERGASPQEYWVSLGAKEPETVDSAIEAMRHLDEVKRVEPLIFGSDKI